MKKIGWILVLMLALGWQNIQAQDKRPLFWGKRDIGFFVGFWSGAYKMRASGATFNKEICLPLAPQAGVYWRNFMTFSVSTELLIPLRRAFPNQHAFGWNSMASLRINMMKGTWFYGQAIFAMYWLQEYMVSDYYSSALSYGNIVRVRMGRMLRAHHFQAYSPFGFGVHTNFGQGLGLFYEWIFFDVTRRGAFPFQSCWRVGLNYGF